MYVKIIVYIIYIIVWVMNGNLAPDIGQYVWLKKVVLKITCNHYFKGATLTCLYKLMYLD